MDTIKHLLSTITTLPLIERGSTERILYFWFNTAFFLSSDDILRHLMQSYDIPCHISYTLLIIYDTPWLI